MSKINTPRFNGTWKGHPISDLTLFRDITLRLRPDKPIIYLAGDSSLDNKAWVSNAIPENISIPPIYDHTLDPPTPKPDVAFWLNHALGPRATCINAAVEETTLAERSSALLPHDLFIRDNLRPSDILIVSVGANDIALRPSAATMRHMFNLSWLARRASIENGTASSLSYFQTLFGATTQAYVARLTAKTKPRAVVVCMIYFPLETGLGQEGWADAQLKALGYGRDAGQLQAVIRKVYERATRNVEVEGVEVVPCAMFEVLDGKKAGDYVARVEPSGEGGRKMARRFVALLDGVLEDWD
ncbi:hypothetical protein BDV95DRAFT_553006 [Massariosphaeria phaeospora]|uniref:SGNH hydrolase-type esterase domain-containing protein n=1 Tax=Massariosphaeria phaeospora TaxID=100035 RepID=A0A7C8M2T5_9PLEO|nr:hypothetical protein BDV95DRAFT_553006 [Massariosphaeria phaeospora]